MVDYRDKASKAADAKLKKLQEKGRALEKKALAQEKKADKAFKNSLKKKIR